MDKFRCQTYFVKSFLLPINGIITSETLPNFNFDLTMPFLRHFL